VLHTLFEKGGSKIEPLYLYDIKEVVKVLHKPVGVTSFAMSGILLQSRVIANASLWRWFTKVKDYSYSEFREIYMEYFI